MSVIVQYPCSQFDHLTSGRTEAEAREVFETWTAAHHPAILETDEALPRWESASYPPFNLQKDTVIIPPCCEPFWNEEWAKQSADCTLIKNVSDRKEIVQKILTERNIAEHPFDDEFVADCYAIATVRFLLALLQRNLHYLQMPDDNRIKVLLTEAILDVRNRQSESARQKLKDAVDELAQSKDNYYPAQNYFLELILVTKTTSGKSLRQLLNEKEKINLFLPCEVLETLPETNRATFEALKTAIEQKKVKFIADGKEPQTFTLLPILDAADSILAGISVYQELLNVSPKIYGRLSAGLSPVIPQLLKLADMNGAIHFAPLDGWRIKEDEQSKIIWQGNDKTNVDALVRYPINASAYIGFFDFADQLGTMISNDHTPTSVFALFPGQQSVWLESLRRIAKQNTGLGKFIDIEEFFNDTAHSGGTEYFRYEKYPINVLTEINADPISSWNNLYQKSSDRLIRSAFETLLTLLRQPINDLPITRQFADAVCPPLADLPLQLDGKKFLAVNPFSFPVKIFADESAIDVPPMGFASFEKTEKKEPAKKKGLLASFFATKNGPVLARKTEDELGKGTKRQVFLLENRFFSAKFDAVTGILRSIFTNRSRYNQLSRQIASRHNKEYSIQAADEITVTKSTAETGQLQIAGRLVCPNGETAARYIETITIRAESRLLEFDLTLEPVLELDDDRWNSYFAVRYAWNGQTFEMRGGLNDGVHLLPDRVYRHSPKLVDLRNEKESLTFFSEGLPFHRRSGDRHLDTLLIVKGESQRTFRLAIGVNVQQPLMAAHNFLLQKIGLVFPVQNLPKNPSSWLFQIESKNVIALHWETLLEEDNPAGLIVYLQETEGRRAHFALRSFLPPKEASVVNFHGKEIKALKVSADAVLIDMHGYELLPVRVKLN